MNLKEIQPRMGTGSGNRFVIRVYLGPICGDNFMAAFDSGWCHRGNRMYRLAAGRKLLLQGSAEGRG